MSHLLGNYGRFDFEPARGEGCWLEDAKGRRVMDFGGGIAVSSLGHAHPALVGAISEQAARVIHCSNLYRISGQEQLATFLVEKTMRAPGKCFFCNSGAEANEALLKLARAHGQLQPDGPKTGIVTFEGSFHGRTFGGISATAQAKIKNGFGPLLPGFTHLPYNDVDCLDDGIGDQTAAVLLEIVQGEGGITVATAEFLLAIAERCAATGALLLVDEVQAGFGRTGHPVAWETVLGDRSDQFQPDAVSWAKGLGGGFPIGAVWISDREVLVESGSRPLSEVLGPGMHGTTFGGSPLASAVGLAVLGTIEKEDLAAKAAALGDEIRTRLRALESPCIREVRGLGLMIGLVVNEAEVARLPGFAEAGQAASIWVVNQLLQRDVLLVPAGTGVVRLLPPLTATLDDFAPVEAALCDLLVTT